VGTGGKLRKVWLSVGLGPTDGVGETDSTAPVTLALGLYGSRGRWIRVVNQDGILSSANGISPSGPCPCKPSVRVLSPSPADCGVFPAGKAVEPCLRQWEGATERSSVAPGRQNAKHRSPLLEPFGHQRKPAWDRNRYVSKSEPVRLRVSSAIPAMPDRWRSEYSPAKAPGSSGSGGEST